MRIQRVSQDRFKTNASLGIVILIIFLSLKLVGGVDWSWWWVITSPLWILFGLMLLFNVVWFFFVILNWLLRQLLCCLESLQDRLEK